MPERLKPPTDYGDPGAITPQAGSDSGADSGAAAGDQSVGALVQTVSAVYVCHFASP
jgi:hypothetical protein